MSSGTQYIDQFKFCEPRPHWLTTIQDLATGEYFEFHLDQQTYIYNGAGYCTNIHTNKLTKTNKTEKVIPYYKPSKK